VKAGNIALFLMKNYRPQQCIGAIGVKVNRSLGIGKPPGTP
jgi:hypothetical protein